jgi:hypothetical protein
LNKFTCCFDCNEGDNRARGVLVPAFGETNALVKVHPAKDRRIVVAIDLFSFMLKDLLYIYYEL